MELQGDQLNCGDLRQVLDFLIMMLPNLSVAVSEGKFANLFRFKTNWLVDKFFYFINFNGKYYVLRLD